MSKSGIINGMEALPFFIKDCALAAIATGIRAHNLRELRDNLMSVHSGSVYYHFWGGLLMSHFREREYNNDFAEWAKSPHGLHDEALAERLAVVDPTGYPSLEDLRQEVVEVASIRLEESEKLRLLHADRPFQFMRSQIVIFDTNMRIEEPHDLRDVAHRMSESSYFFHFIDARRRTAGGVDDFRSWLCEYGAEYEELCVRLAAIDPYFMPLKELRQRIVAIFDSFFGEPHA